LGPPNSPECFEKNEECRRVERGFLFFFFFAGFSFILLQIHARARGENIPHVALIKKEGKPWPALGCCKDKKRNSARLSFVVLAFVLSRRRVGRRGWTQNN
jgi:hypothetical protein